MADRRNATGQDRTGQDTTGQNRTVQGRRIALLIAGLGIAWIALTAAGAALGWSQRLRALFDLAVLAGFGVAIWKIYGLWRDSRKD